MAHMGIQIRHRHLSDGSSAEQWYFPTNGTYWAGRAASSAICLPGVKTVSRKHLQITIDQKNSEVKLGVSGALTTVNGAAVPKGSSHVLRDTMVVTIAEAHELLFAFAPLVACTSKMSEAATAALAQQYAHTGLTVTKQWSSDVVCLITTPSTSVTPKVLRAFLKPVPIGTAKFLDRFTKPDQLMRMPIADPSAANGELPTVPRRGASASASAAITGPDPGYKFSVELSRKKLLEGDVVVTYRRSEVAALYPQAGAAAVHSLEAAGSDNWPNIVRDVVARAEQLLVQIMDESQREAVAAECARCADVALAAAAPGGDPASVPRLAHGCAMLLLERQDAEAAKKNKQWLVLRRLGARAMLNLEVVRSIAAAKPLPKVQAFRARQRVAVSDRQDSMTQASSLGVGSASRSSASARQTHTLAAEPPPHAVRGGIAPAPGQSRGTPLESHDARAPVLAPAQPAAPGRGTVPDGKHARAAAPAVASKEEKEANRAANGKRARTAAAEGPGPAAASATLRGGLAEAPANKRGRRTGLQRAAAAALKEGQAEEVVAAKASAGQATAAPVQDAEAPAAAADEWLGGTAALEPEPEPEPEPQEALTTPGSQLPAMRSTRHARRAPQQLVEDEDEAEVRKPEVAAASGRASGSDRPDSEGSDDSDAELPTVERQRANLASGAAGWVQAEGDGSLDVVALRRTASATRALRRARDLDRQRLCTLGMVISRAETLGETVDYDEAMAAEDPAKAAAAAEAEEPLPTAQVERCQLVDTSRSRGRDRGDADDDGRDDGGSGNGRGGAGVNIAPRRPVVAAMEQYWRGQVPRLLREGVTDFKAFRTRRRGRSELHFDLIQPRAAAGASGGGQVAGAGREEEGEDDDEDEEERMARVVTYEVAVGATPSRMSQRGTGARRKSRRREPVRSGSEARPTAMFHESAMAARFGTQHRATVPPDTAAVEVDALEPVRRAASAAPRSAAAAADDDDDDDGGDDDEGICDGTAAAPRPSVPVARPAASRALRQTRLGGIAPAQQRSVGGGSRRRSSRRRR